MAVSFCIPTDSKWEFLLLLIFVSIYCFQSFSFGPSNRYTVVSHCFNLQFPHDIWCAFFSCAYLPFICRLLWCVCLDLLFMFKLAYMFSYCWVASHILEARSVSDTYFTSIFFPVCRLYFYSLDLFHFWRIISLDTEFWVGSFFIQHFKHSIPFSSCLHSFWILYLFL